MQTSVSYYGDTKTVRVGRAYLRVLTQDRFGIAGQLIAKRGTVDGIRTGMIAGPKGKLPR